MILCNLFGSEWYLFQLIVLLKRHFSCWSNFALSWVDKVITGTKSFASVIVNLPVPAELVITQVDYHVKMRLTSQLINGISRVLQKLLKYFNGKTISTCFVLPSAGLFPVIFFRFKWFRICYYLAHLCNIAINFQMFLNNYHYSSKLHTTLLYQYL